MPLLETLYQLERSRQIAIVPFFYSTQFINNAVAAGTTAQQTIGIQSDSHFVVRYMNITVYNSPNIIVLAGLAPLTVTLFDTGSGRTLMDNPQAIQNLSGGAGGTVGGSGGNLPFIFPEPWLVRAGSTIQVTITNLSSPTVLTGGSTFPRVDVSLPGFKVFAFGGNVPGAVDY